jgi:hypothetical protein
VWRWLRTPRSTGGCGCMRGTPGGTGSALRATPLALAFQAGAEEASCLEGGHDGRLLEVLAARARRGAWIRARPVCRAVTRDFFATLRRL